MEEEQRGSKCNVVEVQYEVSAVCDDLECLVLVVVGPLYVIKSKVNAAIYQEILEHFMFPSATQKTDRW